MKLRHTYGNEYTVLSLQALTPDWPGLDHLDCFTTLGLDCLHH